MSFPHEYISSDKLPYPVNHASYTENRKQLENCFQILTMTCTFTSCLA